MAVLKYVRSIRYPTSAWFRALMYSAERSPETLDVSLDDNGQLLDLTLFDLTEQVVKRYLLVLLELLLLSLMLALFNKLSCKTFVLLENVLLVAEVAELKANPNRLAKGAVIEARLDKGRGPRFLSCQAGTFCRGLRDPLQLLREHALRPRRRRHCRL